MLRPISAAADIHYSVYARALHGSVTQNGKLNLPAWHAPTPLPASFGTCCTVLRNTAIRIATGLCKCVGFSAYSALVVWE